MTLREIIDVNKSWGSSLITSFVVSLTAAPVASEKLVTKGTASENRMAINQIREAGRRLIASNLIWLWFVVASRIESFGWRSTQLSSSSVLFRRFTRIRSIFANVMCRCKVTATTHTPDGSLIFFLATNETLTVQLTRFSDSLPSNCLFELNLWAKQFTRSWMRPPPENKAKKKLGKLSDLCVWYSATSRVLFRFLFSPEQWHCRTRLDPRRRQWKCARIVNFMIAAREWNPQQRFAWIWFEACNCRRCWGRQSSRRGMRLLL